MARVADFLAEKDINPAEKILNLIHAGLDGKDALKAWLELLSYCQAKPTENSDDQDDSDELLDGLSDEVLLKLVKSEVP